MKLSYIAAAAAFTCALSACDVNSLPTFDDRDAFVAFTNTAVSVGEADGTADIPVMLTSLAGLELSCTFEVDAEASTAVEGVHYTFADSEKKISFTKAAPTQSIKLNIIDNDTFDGDVTLVLNLTSSSINLGANKQVVVTISDDEHPLLFLLGKKTFHGESGWYGTSEWDVTITKDASDLSKLWISNFIPESYVDASIYGIVNDDKTEIRIPVYQRLSDYYYIRLEAFYGNDWYDPIPSGGYLVGKISEDGVITFSDIFASYAYNDADFTSYYGCYNYINPGATLK